MNRARRETGREAGGGKYNKKGGEGNIMITTMGGQQNANNDDASSLKGSQREEGNQAEPADCASFFFLIFKLLHICRYPRRD